MTEDAQPNSGFETVVQDWFMSVSASETAIQITVIIPENPLYRRLSAKLSLCDNPFLVAFQDSATFIQFIRNPRNFSISAMGKEMILMWKIVAFEFQKDIQHHLTLIEDQATEKESLEFQIKILKYKLSQVEQQKKVENRKQTISQITQGQKQKQKSKSGSFSSEQASANKAGEQIRMSNKQRRFSPAGRSVKKGRNNHHMKEEGEVEKQRNQGEGEEEESKLPEETDKDEEVQLSTKNSIKKKKRRQKGSILLKRRRPTRKQEDFDDLECQQNMKMRNEDKRKMIKKNKKTQNNRKPKSIEGQSTKVPIKMQNVIDLGGKVRVDFPNGDFYLGELKKNLYHGKGYYFSKLSGIYDGDWSDGRKEGTGHFEDPDKNRYEGMFKAGKRHGKGKEFYVNGEKYEGDFAEDIKSGIGKYTFSNGDYYEGTWKDDMSHGKGKEVLMNGGIFYGTWKNDEKHGVGYFTQRNKVSKQVWESGVLMSEIKASKTELQEYLTK